MITIDFGPKKLQEILQPQMYHMYPWNSMVDVIYVWKNFYKK